jgi:hypothetical protein
MASADERTLHNKNSECRCAYLTVARSDLPAYLSWPSGELHTGRSRVALLVGGKPRRRRVVPGNQTFTAVVYSILPGTHEITFDLTVEEGGDYRYVCRADSRAYRRAVARAVGFLLSLAAACLFGKLTVPMMRGPLLDVESQIISAIPHLNSALVPILYRSVLAITSELGGVIVFGGAFLWATRGFRAKMCSQCLYYLEKSS